MAPNSYPHILFELRQIFTRRGPTLVTKWKQILRTVSPDSHVLPDALRVRLLWLVAEEKNGAISPKIVRYLEHRCQWLANRKLLIKELKYVRIHSFLKRVELEVARHSNKRDGAKQKSPASEPRVGRVPISKAVLRKVRDELSGKDTVKMVLSTLGLIVDFFSLFDW